MSFFVTLTFDIKNGQKSDYDKLYSSLEKIGLKRTVISDNNQIHNIPSTTTVAGEFVGQDSVKVREDLTKKVISIYGTHGVKGEFFLAVGDNWSWAIRYV